MKARTNLKMVVLLWGLFCCGFVNAQNLILWHADGTTTEVELYTQPQVKFEKEKVLVTSSIINIEYDKSDILRFTYRGKETVLNSPKTKNSGIEQKDGQIIIHDIKSTDRIAIYKANGIRLPIQLSIQDGSAILSLSSIPAGIYLLSVNNLTSKFTK